VTKTNTHEEYSGVVKEFPEEEKGGKN